MVEPAHAVESQRKARWHQKRALRRNLTKRKQGVTGQGDMMEIEVMPIVGADKAETLHLKRIKLSNKSR